MLIVKKKTWKRKETLGEGKKEKAQDKERSSSMTSTNIYIRKSFIVSIDKFQNTY